MGGEGAPSCADKKKKLAERDGGVWKPRKRSPPAPPAGACGPAALATVPSLAHVLCARAAGLRVPALACAAQARIAGVSQRSHLPCPTPIIISTGTDACCLYRPEDKVSSQVAEVKRVPAQTRP